MPTKLEKKSFIQYLLKSHEAKRRECVWILNYILNHDSLLDKIHFTDEARSKELSMVIGFKDTIGIPFRYYVREVMSADAEKGFNKLRMLHEDEKFYIEVNYPGKYKDINYMDIVEGEVKTEVESKEMHDLMKEIVSMNHEYYINQALDTNDKELFYQLTGGQA